MSRKPVNTTAEEVREKLAAYLKECEEKKRPLSATRLALALGYSSRVVFNRAMRDQKSEEVREALREAHSHYVAAIEERAMEGKGGGLMLLLNSQGYVSKTESKTESKVVLDVPDQKILLAKMKARQEQLQMQKQEKNVTPIEHDPMPADLVKEGKPTKPTLVEAEPLVVTDEPEEVPDWI